MTLLVYEMADDFCKDALLDPLRQNNPLKWLETYADLYRGISKLQNNEDSKPLMLFGNKFYLQLGSFHGEYVKLLYEKNILNYLTHEEAIIYFFEKMDIFYIDKFIDVNTSQNIEKYQFMQYLNEAFDEMKNRGNTCLGFWPGINNENMPNHKSYCFIGNRDKSFFEIHLEFDAITKQVINICETANIDYIEGFVPENRKKIIILPFNLNIFNE